MLQKHVAHPDGVDVAGWTIRVTKGAIDTSVAKDALGEQLNLGGMPEMVFSKNRLSLAHGASGFELLFDAVDALKCVAHEPPKGIKVKASHQWTQSNQSHVATLLDPSLPLTPEQARLNSFDWTFTAPYFGSLKGPSVQLVAHHTAAPSSSSTAPSISTNSASTSSTSSGSGSGSAPTSPRGPAAAVAGSSFIPLHKLTSPDPFLFYDEVHLFEDELSDNGISELSVKIRVMPSYWFCLLRQWIRVDDVLYRILDTRLFLEFGTNQILRESSTREAPWSAIERHIRDLKQLNDVNYIASLLPMVHGPIQQVVQF